MQNICIHTTDTTCDLTPIGMEGMAGGRQYTVTKSCILRDGKPYILRMGELHYSRVPACDWEREIEKMKAGGLDVVSSYVFWNHHEATEGQFDFSGNRDIRRFVDTCEKAGMPFYLRIGPWAHGEARYGGFPDWLVANGCELRSTDPTYLTYVRRLFTKIYEELRGSKNIIGIQVENEMTWKKPYMAALWDMLREIGFTAPLWSATAWGQADLPEGLLPMYGGYPEAPWEGHTKPLSPNPNYFFASVREDGVVGKDLLGESQIPEVEKYHGKYPYLTCELGGGNQNTYHRRPVFSTTDITALAICKLGSGAVGLGYYMYHGGVNPVETKADGTLTTYQESRETGYPNDCPVVSYDFQSPLGDCGQVRDSYYALGLIHRFVDAVGEKLATMPSFLPETMPENLADTTTPRVAVRSDGKSGFVFYNNHIHGGVLPEKTCTLHLPEMELTIPLTLPENGCGVFPIGMQLGNETVRYIKAMPVSITPTEVEFVPLEGIAPVVCLADGVETKLYDGMTIGGIKVRLTRPIHHVPRRGVLLPVTTGKRTLPFTVFAHLRRLDGSHLTDCAVESAVHVLAGVEQLRVQVCGNVAAAFDGDTGRLLSDHFCDGDIWVIDVRGVETVRFLVQPLTESDRDTIYREVDMPENESTLRVWGCGKE